MKSSKKLNYINSYNKSNYKMYQFRIRKDSKLISTLDNIENRNKYILSLIENDQSVLTIKEIKQLVKPICDKHKIKEIFLFGSYARGEANKDSDVDIYCDRGNIKNLYDLDDLHNELSKALNKKVDIVFTISTMDEYFRTHLMQDLIKLC